MSYCWLHKNILAFLGLFLSALSYWQLPPPPINTPGISVTHDQYYCADGPTAVVETVSITDPDNSITTLDEVFIQITTGYQNGADVLSLTGFHNNISSEWVPDQGVLRLFGLASFDEYEVAIESVVFETSETVHEADRSIAINLSEAIYLPSNGHYYQYVADPGITWSQALSDASGFSFFGIQGYLVTITSEDEAQLVGEQNPGTGWIGATDQAEEGVWRWASGPESGLVFWVGDFNGAPPSNEYSFWNCAEPNNVGDEDYAHITSRGVAGCGNSGDPDYYGSWNDLPNDFGTTNPSNPYYPQGYVVEFGGLDPNEPQLELSASSLINMPVVELESLEACDSFFSEITLQGNADTFYWYNSPDDAVEFFIGDTYTANISSSVTYWISPRYGSCSSGGREPLFIGVYPLPEAVDQIITQCDSQGDTDGITEFNLSIYDQGIAGGDLLNKQLTYFEDENLTIEIDKNAYTNQFNGQVVYAAVTQTISGCVNVAEVELRVTVPNSNSAYLEECDDLPEDGFTLFDLTLADDQVITESDSEVSTTYFETYEDALLQVNPLPLDFRNTTANYQIIYVRLQQGNSCFGIDEVELVVRPLPQLRPDETVYYCRNTFPEPILIDGGISNGIPNNYYYNWSTGETTIAIEVNEPGTYSVEVSEVVGCTNLRTITVLPSETATIENVVIEATGDLNTLVVEVSGSGEYEYSLESPLGPYQNSNTFEGVGPGVKTVYVRDVKGYCGVASKDISIIGYPKFFTPNNDGQNDRWGLKGFNSQIPFEGIVRVFDRNGKQLAELNPSNPFWDGTYNGRYLPASDYWFIAQLEGGQRFTGHFALRR